MPNLNRVFLMGNLTRDPELRYVPSGAAVVSFGIAVNRFYTTADGEKKEDVSYIRIVVWGKRAEVCSQYLHKGSPVFVEGRLQSRSWETPDGQKRSTVEVVAQRVEFLGKVKSETDIVSTPEELEDTESGPDEIFDENIDVIDETQEETASKDDIPF